MKITDEELKKLNTELATIDTEDKLIQLAPEQCIEAVKVFINEASEFVVSVADLLFKTNAFQQLHEDSEIKEKIERWIKLLNTATRLDSLNDEEVYWRYMMIDLDCLLLAEDLRCLIRDKVDNAQRGYTPLKLANNLTTSMSEVVRKVKNEGRMAI